MCLRDQAQPLGSGDQITYLLTGEQTGGAFFLAEVSGPPGGGPPPHIHRRRKRHSTSSKEQTVQVGDKILQASPGDCVYLPRGIMHSFKNTGNRTRSSWWSLRRRAWRILAVAHFDRLRIDSGSPPLMIDEAMLSRLLTAAAITHGLEFAPPA